jgi:peroxiredoxin
MTQASRRFSLRGLSAAALCWLTMVACSQAGAAPRIGAPAPAFTGTDTSGAPISLADFKGKVVVLEWTNDGCPFVRKHYGSGNMQALQQEATASGVVWLSIISSAPGKQGYVDAARADELTRSRGAHPTHVLLDPSGTIGRLYGAKTTPHMYVIDQAGRLVYMGGIDDIPSARVDDIPKAHNYVRAALNELHAGKPVAQPVSRPYGCSVKY